MSVFARVARKLKIKMDFRTDKELYDALGMSKGAYHNRKSDGSIPYQKIIELCEKHNISLDWLFLDRAEPSVEAANSIININSHVKGFQNVVISPKDYADTDEVAEIVELLRFAPKPYLDALLVKLLQFREMTKA